MFYHVYSVVADGNIYPSSSLIIMQIHERTSLLRCTNFHPIQRFFWLFEHGFQFVVDVDVFHVKHFRICDFFVDFFLWKLI